MKKIYNCYNCNHMKEDKCHRREEHDGKIVPIIDKTMKLSCPCHSHIEEIKRAGAYIDDGLFNPTMDKKMLLILKKIIFNK